jgi:hypothetical protein
MPTPCKMLSARWLPLNVDQKCASNPPSYENLNLRDLGNLGSKQDFLGNQAAFV